MRGYLQLLQAFMNGKNTYLESVSESWPGVRKKQGGVMIGKKIKDTDLHEK